MIKETPIDCLIDCTSICCRQNPNFRISFDFTLNEAQMMQNTGVILTQNSDKDGYYMDRDCPFVTQNGCDLHGKFEQPECCRVNLAGGDLCRFLRSHSNTSKRYSEVE